VALAQQHVGVNPVAGAADAGGRCPVINDTRFGVVTASGETYEHDIYILADGTVKKRKKKAVKKLYGTSHWIGPEELEQLLKGAPELLVIGTGQSGSAELTAEGAEFLRGRGIRFEAVPTPKAIEAYNHAQGRKAPLLHVTC